MPVAKAYLTQLFLSTLYTFALFGSIMAAVLTLPLVVPASLGQQLGVQPWMDQAASEPGDLYCFLGAIVACALGLFYRSMNRVVAPAKAGPRLNYQTATLLYMLAMSYGLAVLAATGLAPQYRDCETYTQKLNGGVRQYRGLSFRVELCGAGPRESDRLDRVRLRIYDESGDLRAVRYFGVQWGRNFPALLEYSRDHLSYFDAGDEEDFARVIAMPPTLSDWVQTRIPLLD
ncbi:hypothetical protein EJD96_02495 [Herbaspirillum seropedicae]|uniref:hypothetical protein n=1 Tax=Herbaspirillum seropedicae TaxID=964 RepID=UPI001122C0D1|nr:hypothetical protein [Herbaspirillum seropedicae]QDD63093.1 hypothetical protein EJD96_02495 [Herbaspirillum seropedicae]